MQGFLRYGESIVLYADLELDDEAKAKLELNEVEYEQFSGFLSTKGYLDKQVYFQTLSKKIDENLQTVQSISNARDFVFTVTPKLRYEFNITYQELKVEYKKLLTAYKNLENDADKAHNNEKAKNSKEGLFKNFERRVEKARQRALKEDELNERLMKESAGELVRYGDEVQMMHKDSKGFLDAKNECSKTDQIGYKLEIRRETSSRMIFSFVPRYKSHKIGDAIQYGDNLRAMNVHNSNNLAVSPLNVSTSREINGINDNPYICKKYLVDPKSNLHTAFLGGESFSTWKIFLHSRPKLVKDDTDKLKLEGGDLVRIRHSELSAYLCSSLNFEGENPEVYFRQYYGKYLEEMDSLNTIWEICHGDVIFQGKKIDCMLDQVVLRHFNSGRVMKIETEPMSGKTSLENVDYDYEGHESEIPKTKLYIVPVQTGMTHVQVDTTYRFKYDNDRVPLYLSHTEKNLSRDTLERKSQTLKMMSEVKFTPLEDEFFDVIRSEAEFKETINVEEAYIFTKISEKEKKDLLYLRSALPAFIELSNIYKYSQRSKLHNQKLVEIEELIKRLISFLYNVEFNPDDDYLEFMDANEPLNTKQIIFKDFNFIELLVDLIHYPFMNEFYRIDKIHKDELYAPQMISLCYSCLRYAIMEYRPSELYASQWLNLFIDYSLGELDDSLKANETLTELIDNNQVILETRIKKSTINKFVTNLVESGGEKKFVDILRAICICNETPMKANQNIISLLILGVANSRERLILPLMFKGKDIFARDPWAGLEQWVPLKNLESLSKERDDGKFYNFYCSSIFLMSDLCQDRNYTAIDMLKNYYSVRICVEIIISNKYRYDLRSAFCNLTENMWINANPFIIVSIPSNLKIWNNLNHEKLSKTSTKNFDNLSQYKELTTFIFKYLGDENSLLNWEESGFFMLQIIKLSFRMFKLGFYNERHQFKKLYESFERILKKTDEIALEESDFFEEKVDLSKIDVPVIIINIKKKICEMMKMMLTVQNDFRLTVILERYKSKYEETKHKQLENSTSENEDLLRKSTALANAQGRRFSLSSLIRNTGFNAKDSIQKEQFRELFESDFTEENINFIKKESSFISLLQKQTLYKDQELKSYSLDLLYNFYKTGANLSQRIREIQILDSANQIEEYRNLEEIRNYLFRLGETIEIWYTKDNCKEMNQLNLLLRRLESNLHQVRRVNLANSIDGVEESDDMNMKIENNLFLDTHLKQAYSNIDKFSQDLSRNSSCLGDIIEILYHMSEHDRLNRSTSRAKKEIAYYCHLILAEACYENVNNKIFLSDHFEDLLLKNLEFDSRGYNVMITIKALLKNNKVLLFNKQRVKNCLRKIFDQFSKEHKNPLRLAYYLFTVQHMIYFNSFSIRANQNFIISHLISSKLNHIFKSLHSDNLRNKIRDDISRPKITFNNRGKTIQYVSDELCFDLAFIELISNCSFDKNAFAENIAQTIITAENLIGVLQLPEKHELFEYEFFKFIFHVYVETERVQNSHTQAFLFDVMKWIKQSFVRVLKGKWDKNTKLHYLTHKELVSDYQVKVDLCNIILLNLKFFIKEVCKETVLKIDKKNFKNFVYFIKKLIEDHMVNVKNEFASKKLKTFKSFLDNVVSRNKHFRERKIVMGGMGTSQAIDANEMSYDDILSVAESVNNQEIGGNAAVKKMDEIMNKNNLKKESGKIIENPFVSKLSKKATIRRSEDLVSIFRQSFMAGFQKVNLLESSKTSIFQVMSTMYFQSPEFEKLKNSEFAELVESEKHNPTVFNNFLESLIKYIDPKNKQKSDIVNIGLAIFKQFVVSDRGSLQNIEDKIKKKNRKRKRKKKNQAANSSSHTNNIEGIRLKQRIMKFKQDLLVKIGIVRLLIKIIIHNEDLEILKMAVEVSNQLLEGGNRLAQKEFLVVLKEMSEERVIFKLKKVLQEKFGVLSKLMSKENSHTMNKMIYNKKTYDLASSDTEGIKQMNSLCITLIQFFQLLCEGQNIELQTYLRIQFEDEDELEHNSKNVNIVKFIVDLFGNYVKFFNSSCYELGNIILEFMMESIQGPCRENQTQMMNSKVLDFCKDFMNDINSGDDLRSKGFYADKEDKARIDKDEEILDDLFTNTIQFLLSLMEGNSNKEEIERIGNNVKLNHLLKKLRYTYLEHIKIKILRQKYPRRKEEELEKFSISPHNLVQMGNSKLFDEEALEAFDIFFFIQTIQEYSSTYSYSIKHMHKELYKEAYDFFEFFCGNIELMFQSKLQKVYFVKHPASMYLDSEDKENLMNEVRRENINEKISDFLEGAPSLFDRMDHSFDLDKRCGISPNLLETVRTLAFLVACGINIYMLTTFEKKVVLQRSSLDLTNQMKLAILCLGIFHLVLAFMMVILQFLIHTEFHYYNRLRIFINNFKKKFVPLANPDNSPEDQLLLGYLEKNIMELTYSEKSRILNKDRQMDSGIDELITPLMMAIVNLEFYLSDGVFRYFIFYFSCSFCAIYFKSYFLYALPLLEVVNRDETLLNVIKATYYNGWQLFVTGLLFLAFTYLYALFGYFFIPEAFWNSSFGDNGENQCINVTQCFYTMLSLGPRSSGGIGDMMVRESYSDGNRPRYYVRFFYDVSCFIVINIILMNIVFGIIIDTFAELRNKNTTLEENKKSFCFICSLPKHKFDKTKQGYEHHVNYDHDPWNYLFYLYHLKKKDKTEFTGIDTYVQHMLDKDDHFWIPIEKALVISRLDKEETSIEDKIGVVCEKINSFMDENDRVLEKKERRLKLLKL